MTEPESTDATPKRARRARRRKPAQAATPDEPTTSAEPTEPTEATASAEPTEPGAPTEPAAPTEPSVAPEPVGPEGPSEPGAAEPSSGRRWVRPVASWVLAVLASIGIAASMLALWVHDTVLDTENFVEAIEPAVRSQAVQEATADYVSTQVIDALALEDRIEAALANVDERLADGLSEALDLSDDQFERLRGVDLDLTVLAAPIASGLESRIADAVTEFVTDPRVADAIVQAAAVAHERTVLLLRDEFDQLPNLVVEDGEVRVNLVPLIARAIRTLVDNGMELVGIDANVPDIPAGTDPTDAIARLAGFIGADLPDDFGQVSVLSEDRLRELQDLVTTFDRVVWALVIVTIGIAFAAVATAPSVGSGAIRVAVGGAIGVLLGWLLIEGVAAWVTGAVASPGARLALEEVVGALVGSLRPLAIVLALLGFGAAATAYAAGHRSER